MTVRVTPLQAIQSGGLRGFGFSVFIDRDEDAHSISNQARNPSHALAAGPVGSPLPGPADQSEEARDELMAQAQQLGMGYK